MAFLPTFKLTGCLDRRSPVEDQYSRPCSGVRSRARTPAPAVKGYRAGHRETGTLSTKPPLARHTRDYLPDTRSTPSRQAVNGPAGHGEEKGDNSSYYCVIRSGHVNQGRAEPSSSGHARHSRQLKDIVNNKGTQSFVLTADTASLLLQSGSPLVIRSAADVYSGDSIKSAIHKVSEANRQYRSGSVHARRSKSGVTCDRRTVNRAENSAALARSNSLHSAPCEDRRFRRSQTQVVPDTASGSESAARYSSAETLHRLRSHSLKRQADNVSWINLHTLSDVISPEWQQLGVGPTSHQAFTRSRTAPDPQQFYDLVMASRAAGKNLPASKVPNGKGAAKTLSPSKHGYHPRSQSPTFKRLVVASERLAEILTGECKSSPKASTFEDTYENTSSDSVKGLQLYNEIINKCNSDLATSDSTSTQGTSPSHKYKTREARGLPSGLTTTHRDISEIDLTERKQRAATREQRQIKGHRRNVSLERTADLRVRTPTEDLTIVNDENYLTNIMTHRNSDPISEVGAVNREGGQPTHLHFFLPQLADGMSEVSGQSLTGRSHYQEQRLELWSRREWADNQNGKSYPSDTFNNRLSYQQKHSSSHNPDHSKPSSHAKQGKHTAQEQGRRNVSKDRVTARDVKNGCLTLNHDHGTPPGEEYPRHRRHVSPMRTAQKGERPSRKKGSMPARSGYYMETQLPGETLKKQLDDFPTLVSMDYSDTDSSLPVR